MADITPDYEKPTVYNLGDTFTEDQKYDKDSPYLGMADVLTPEPDLKQQERSRGAAKATAFGDVLSSLFDTAVATTGGIVEKTGESKAQLRNLAEFNRDRAEAEMEGRQHRAAKLQDLINNARYSIEEKRIRDAAKLRGYMTNAEKDWQTREDIRKQKAAAALAAANNAAEYEKYKMIYGEKKDINNTTVAGAKERANISASTKAASKTSTSKLIPFADSKGVSYGLNTGGINAVFNKIIEAIRDKRIDPAVEPGVDIVDLMNNFNKYSPTQRTSVVYRLFEKDPQVFDFFKSQSMVDLTNPKTQTEVPVSLKASVPKPAAVSYGSFAKEALKSNPSLTDEQLSDMYDKLNITK